MGLIDLGDNDQDKQLTPKMGLNKAKNNLPSKIMGKKVAASKKKNSKEPFKPASLLEDEPSDCEIPVAPRRNND